MLKLKILGQKAMHSIKGGLRCCADTSCNCKNQSADYGQGSASAFITAFGNNFGTMH